MNVIWRTPTPRWRRNPPVGFIRPCEPTLTDRPPAGPGWPHEVKHGGFRVLAGKQGERVPGLEPPQLGLEGIVSKRAGSLYKSGRSRNWFSESAGGLVDMRAGGARPRASAGRKSLVSRFRPYLGLNGRKKQRIGAC
jgi:hypothetical protein